MEAYEYISEREWVHDCVFNVIHIYFPTPWPWSMEIYHPGLSHRLVCDDFVEEAYRILKPGGVLRFVTDCNDYYEEVCKCFKTTHWWAVDWRPMDLGQGDSYIVGTPCEINIRENKNAEFYQLQLIRL
jgi:tRNA G46 methylase TrmB